jgi:hypothetical protein
MVTRLSSGTSAISVKQLGLRAAACGNRVAFLLSALLGELRTFSRNFS